MSKRAPLTQVELRMMWDRNPDSADVQALLWEVKRLRSIVLRADQLQKLLGEMSGAQGLVLKSVRLALKDEPCVAEFPKLD